MNRDDSQLVLHDVPILLWLFGLIFAGVGTAIILEGGPPPVVALILFGIGLGFLLFTSVHLVTLNLLQPSQADELVSLGVELVKCQSSSLEQLSSAI
jgi:hypothetical protein